VLFPFPNKRNIDLSKYDQFATVMRDDGLLVAALQDLGHTVEVFQEALGFVVIGGPSGSEDTRLPLK
jgi:hypothetical protein